VRIIAVTGGIGSGKTTAVQRLAERGAVALDLDVIGRTLTTTPGKTRDRVVEAFGDAILADDGAVDAVALARVAFASDEATAELNRIVHPAVLREVMNGLNDLELLAQPPRLVVIDVPLLVEAPAFAEIADRVVAVSAPVETRVARCVARGQDESDVRARVARQATDAQREGMADMVIHNTGTLQGLRDAIDRVWDREVG
jgi:dephospho-CoA kinase